MDFEYKLDSATTQLFIDLQIAAKIRQGLISRCNGCGCARTSSILLSSPSPWLFIYVLRCVRPQLEISEVLEIRGETGLMTYRLFGIVYYNGEHFVGIWADMGGPCWGFDGLAHGGRPERLGSAGLTMLREYNGCEIHITLYALEP